MEQWQEIFDGYLVSTLGNVDSVKRGKRRRLRPSVKKNGYLQVLLSFNGERKYFTVHRLVALAFIPNPDNKPQVNHINGIKADNRIENLEWCTGEENRKHAYSTGLYVARYNEDAPSAKFTNEQVRFIRDNPDKLTIRQIATMFGVQHTTISAIQLGECYRSAGGKIRTRIDNRIPDDIREQIKRLYVKGKHGCGSTTLAKIFGLGKTTVKSIIRTIHKDN